MRFEGRIWLFRDDDINTDLIYPGKYTYEPFSAEEQATKAMEDYDSNFAQQVQKNDIIVTGENFGCGSSREQAVTCLKKAGVSAIVARSFARLFYRNAINMALAVIECRELVDLFFSQIDHRGSTKTDWALSIDLSAGKITSNSRQFSIPAWDKQAMLIFESGGLVEFTRQRLLDKDPVR
jgi:3-isopropylmalate/(R)-2-methylmalate dehydratase small subunit